MSVHFVFIHGFLGNEEMWNEIIHSEFQNQKTSQPQLAGHGNDRIIELPTIQEFAKDILNQIEIQPHEKLIWIGHSMGGYVALELGKMFPEITAGIVLFHSTANADTTLKKQDRLRAIEAAKEHKALYASNLIDGLFHKPNNHRTAIDQQLHFIQNISTQTTIACLEAMRQRDDSFEFLNLSQLPLFYFAGTHDKVLPLDRMQKEWEQLPHAKSVIAFQSGHMGHIEKPMMACDFFNQIAMQFSS
ncbi:MAG: alpha/beta fold hydrolase [Bacteroidota bacterium]